MVHQSLPTAGGDVPADTGEQFLAVLCAEEELLRAEFDAIVTAEWPAPAPPHTVVGVYAEDAGPGKRARRGARGAPPWGRPSSSGISRWARQRSPPPPPMAPKPTPTPTPNSGR